MSKLLKYCQQGGNPENLVNAESGEVYKDAQGSILKVNENAPSHDDGLLVNGNSVSKAKYNEGGVVIPANSVLSATHENRDKSDASYGELDEAIKITSKELDEYATSLGFKKINYKKTVSPSKAFELLREQKIKKANEYLKSNRDVYDDKYKQQSIKLNETLANNLISDEELYDTIFGIQELKKQLI